MSSSRNIETKSENSVMRQDVKTATQTVLTAVSVATVLYPLELIQTRIQLQGSSIGAGRLGFLTWGCLANYKPLMQGYLHANKTSLVKNTMISNRETVHGEVDQVMGENNARAGNRKLTTTLVAGSVIGFMDAASTNYFANARFVTEMAAMTRNSALNEAFKGLNTLERMQFARLGFGVRYLRNFSTASFCISTNTIAQAPLERVLPRETFGATASVAATVIPGMISGFVANGFDVIYKNKIKGINLSNMTVPSANDVVKALVSEEKSLRVFSRGSAHSILTTTTAFGVINGVDYLLNRHAFPAVDSFLRSNAGFFKPAGKLNTPVAKPVTSVPRVEEPVEAPARKTR